MKRLDIIIAGCLAVLPLTVGCSKEDKGAERGVVRENAPEGWSGYKVRIEDNVTKTVLADRDRVAWVSGDKVRVFGAGSADLSVVAADYESSEAFLTGSMPAEREHGTKFSAYYPAGIATLTGNVISLNLPETRACVNNDNPMQWCPMYAESNENYFVFRNLCGMLELNAKGTGLVKKIEILSTDATSALMSGDFSINASGAAAIKSAGASRKAVLTFSGSVSLTTEGVKFYVALPAGTYKSLIIRFFDNAGKVSGAKLAGSFTVARGQVYMADTEVTFNEGVQLWKDGPYWATLNLGAISIGDPGTYYQYGSTVKIYEDIIVKPDVRLASHRDGTYSESPEYPGGACTATAQKLGLPGIRAGNFSPLPAEYDAVTKIMGAGWHIPTKDDYQKLIDNTSRRFNGDTLNTAIYEFRGKGDFAGNRIFIPSSGWFETETKNPRRIMVSAAGCRVLLWTSTSSGSGKDGWSFEVPGSSDASKFSSWSISNYIWAWPYRGITY